MVESYLYAWSCASILSHIILDGTHVYSKFVCIFFLSFSFVTVEVVAGSAAWLGRGFSCVCVQRRDIDDHPSFDLTPAQVVFCLVGLFVLYFWEHFPVCVAFTARLSSI